MFLRLIATLAASAIVTTSVFAQGLSAAAVRRIDSLFHGLVRAPSPGVSIAVVRDGKIVLAKGYGLASLEHRVPITDSTVFDIASISKQFAGLSVAMLADQGRINLDDDIKRYIPEMSSIGSTITVRHLLHHTSGLRDWPGTLMLAGWRFDDVISFDQILRFAWRQRSLNFAPGSEYMYSNTGYNLLAELVARVSGRSFREWTDENLFRPLGMAHSSFHDDHTRVVERRAFGYARQPNGTFRATTDNLTALGSSSLFSTATDLARWIINFETRVAGSARAHQLFFTRGRLNDGSEIPYAFGISHGQYRGLPTVSHSGSWASFLTYLVYFPQQRFGVVVLGNSGVVNPTRAALNIADVALEGALAPAAAPVAPDASVQLTADDVASYAGLYRLGPGWYVRITANGTSLTTQATRESAFPMRALSRSEFWVAGYNASMAFETHPGQPVQLVYRNRRHPVLDESPRLNAQQLREFAGTYESDELGTAYRVEERNGQLVMEHPRHGTIPLTRLWRDDFSGSLWFLRSVEFQRDAAGGITGFAVFVDDRSRNIRFIRR